MTTSWLHALLGITHNAKHHKKVCENKETDSPSGIYRMKLPGTCSLSKENEVKEGGGGGGRGEHAQYQRRVIKKKMGLLFWGSGTPTFWLGLLLFTKRESRTPTFKILVRTLQVIYSALQIYLLSFKALALTVFETFCSQGKSAQNYKGPKLKNISKFLQKLIRLSTNHYQSIHKVSRL